MAYSEDDDLNRHYNDFCTCVGHLFITFARLEGTLASLLRIHLSNTLMPSTADHQAAQLASALFGAMRFKAARDTLRRIVTVRGATPEVEGFLDGFFAHLGHIENLRDKLAHLMVVPSEDPAEGYWQVSDVTVTRNLKNLKVFVFDTSAVHFAAADLVTAAHRLGGGKFSELDPSTLDISPVAWRYRQEMLKLVPLKSGRTLSGRRTPPPPSLA
jgi:hypothetical protein